MYKAVITNVSEVRTDGTVSVTWDLMDDDDVLNGGEVVVADPVAVRDIIRGKASELSSAWDAKSGLLIGEVIEW